MNGRILVVDDEAIIRTFLAEGLTDAGYHVLTAHNGAEALDRVHVYQPDAILLDLLMPVMDGWGFLRERRTQPTLAAVPVVVFSAAGREGLHDAAVLHANAVLPKPLDLEVLSAVLGYVLSDARKCQATLSAGGPACADGSVGVDGSVSANGGASPGGSTSAGRRVGTCPICAIAVYAHVDDSLSAPARIRAIHAARRAHVLSHSARDIAHVPLRTRLLQMPIAQRRILADWVYRELRQQWGDADRRDVHSIDDALNSVALHRLWQDAIRCAFPNCPHG